MRSLFVKIFLWFWVASIFIIVSTLVLISLLEPYRPLREDSRQVRRLARVGNQAINILDRNGLNALQGFLQNRGRRPGTRFFLLDEMLKPVAGQSVPPEAKKLAVRASESGVTEFIRSDRSLMLARPLFGTDGKMYIIAGEVARHPRASTVRRFMNPRFLSLRLLAIFIVASVFCYWLAWYLTAPVRKLRAAAQEFASGNLKARVVPELGGRKDELADLGRDFDLMAGRIESLIASQGRLLRDISHELRSPLARLNVALELARRRSGKEAEESLDRMEREAERMNSLIGQLRTLTLLESGSGSMDKEPLDLSALVQEISDDASFETVSRNLSIHTELDEHAVVYGSEELLRRAIENVVRNAIRYAPEGTAVEISLHRLLQNGKESAVIRVRDHGPGVSEDELAHLFSPFYRVAESRDRQSGGMGVGLAITDRAVKLHGGEVKAVNAPDSGLIVEIYIPAAKKEL